jgi:ribosomal-protein-alanine N-acetyltransferase
MVDLIQTERCILARPVDGDRHAIYRLRTEPEVRRFLGGANGDDPFESEFAKIVGAESDRYWAVRLRSDQTFVGLISMSAYHNEVDTEVSYEFLPEWWGRGLATESIGAVVDRVLEDSGVDRLVAETQAANLPSRRLLERLGMNLINTVLRFGGNQVVYTTGQT